MNNSQMLMLHFIMGGSWTQLYKRTAGLTRIKQLLGGTGVQKKCWNLLVQMSKKLKECNFLKPFRITLTEPTICVIHGDGTH